MDRIPEKKIAPVALHALKEALALIYCHKSDLHSLAVLEGAIDLVQLLLRKRRTAAQTGNIYLKVHEILTGSA